MGTTLNLDRNWQFHLGEVEDGFYKGQDDSTWQTVTLPHDWSVGLPFSEDCSSGTGYLPGGIGWYRRKFSLPKFLAGDSVFVTFGGVYCNSRVWCNSHYLGKRPYGYSSFTYDITDFLCEGENMLAVKVSHAQTADSRWYTGSGIYRDVTLKIVHKLHFAPNGEGIFCHTASADERQAVLKAAWKLCGGKGEVHFLLRDKSGQTVAENSDTGEAGTVSLLLHQPRLWSPESPYLYTLVCETIRDGTVTDTEELPVGVRTFRFDPDEGFFLNEKAKKLRGVCLHHDAGALGAAVPAAVWERRLLTLKSAGCNAIRTSHNPPDPVLLNLCDSLGFLVMDEAFDEWEGCKNKWWHGHNVRPPKHFGYSDDFPVWHERDLSDMIKRDRNHPSVILWSIGNEIDYPGDPYVFPAFQTMCGNNDAGKSEAERRYDPNKPDAARLTSVAEKLAGIVRSLDATRPVTAALAFPEMSKMIGLHAALDVVGYNYKEQLYDADHKSLPTLPLLGSENGHGAAQWEAVTTRPYIAGQFLWTGIDYLGEAAGWPVRASGAGLLDLSGREKPLYFQRQALWNDTLCASLSTGPSDNLREQGFSWNYGAGDLVTVTCCTNASRAELYQNGVSLGEQAVPAQNCCVTWKVPFSPGVLRAVCTNEAGDTAEAMLQTAGSPAELKLTPLPGTQNEPNGTVVHLLRASLLDENGILVPNADRTLRFSVHNGTLLGLENGDIADLTPYCSPARSTLGGVLLAYIRAARGEEITLEVQGEELRAACRICR